MDVIDAFSLCPFVTLDGVPGPYAGILTHHDSLLFSCFFLVILYLYMYMNSQLLPLHPVGDVSLTEFLFSVLALTDMIAVEAPSLLFLVGLVYSM